MFALSQGRVLTQSTKPIRILVVDDHFMVRMGLSASLNAEPDMEVVAEVGNGQAALEAYSQHRPNLVLMDVRLPGMSGAETTAALLRSFPGAYVLMLSTHSGEEEIYRAMQAGARGYLLKSVLREDLLRAIREVHAGKRHLDPIVASHLAERVSHRSLTSRELEVLRMVAKGWGNKEIANALNIAEITVKLHVSHVLEKLNVKDRTEAATAAVQRGIISLD
jgi:DNA-binding NarL/FixJ family response regulator